MKLAKLLICLLVFVCVAPAADLLAQGQRGQRGQNLTPEERAEQERRAAAREAASGRNAVRPIDMLDTVWMEEMTWMEVRDHIAAGKTIAIIGTGGLEQNGPYMPTGKHNYVLRTTCEAIARRMGDAICAPVVPLEPGNPNGDMYPGSLYITQETYRAWLRDMATSLKSMGFKDIVFIGDSGGNRSGMQAVTDELNAEWKGNPARVHHVTEYYEEDIWSYDFMKSSLGIVQQPDVRSATRWDIHDDYHYEALVAAANPKLLRAEQRQKAGRFSIYGVNLESVEKVLENARKLADYRAEITERGIRKAIAEFKAPQD